MTKQDLIDELRAMLVAELAVSRKTALETAAAANHPEARPENDKDTRKVELSYLAAGQAARARELDAALALVSTVPVRVFRPDEPISAGALVQIEVDESPQCVLLCPAGGGKKLGRAGDEVSVVTPEAPLGRGLLGRRAGESFEIAVGGRVREVEIVSVE